MKLPKFLYNRLKNHNTSLSNNLAFPPERECNFDYFLIKKRYNEVYEKLQLLHYDTNDITNLSNKLSTLINKCKIMEKPIHEQLIQASKNIIYSLFNIPEDSIDIKCELVDQIKPNHAFRIIPEDNENDFEFDDLNDFDNMSIVVLKRRFINSLIQGISYQLSEENVYKSFIEKINPQLLPLYKEIRIINDFLLFNTEEKISDKNPKQGSCVEVELGMKGEQTQIYAQGIIFPFLLNDLIRGMFELFASHGLPEDNKKAAYIIKHADFLLAEPWDLRFGVPLWSYFMKNNKNTKILPYLFTNLCKLKVNDFNNNMREILAQTKLGKKLFQDLINKSEHEYKLSNLSMSFDKENKKSLIVDQYMTEDDIENENISYLDLFDNIDSMNGDNIDFAEEQINEYQFQMHVIINNKIVPISSINFKAEPRTINNEVLYQIHLFIEKKYQHKGLGYKIIKRFIELYGNAYCGNGRMMNKNEIPAIFKKLDLEPNIIVSNVLNSRQKYIGIEAKLI